MRNERTRLHDNLRHYLARLERRIEAREALTRRLGTIRLGLVIAGAAIVYVAYQTIGPSRAQKSQEAAEGLARRKPGRINTCHAFASDGPIGLNVPICSPSCSASV